MSNELDPLGHVCILYRMTEQNGAKRYVQKEGLVLRIIRFAHLGWWMLRERSSRPPSGVNSLNNTMPDMLEALSATPECPQEGATSEDSYDAYCCPGEGLCVHQGGRGNDDGEGLPCQTTDPKVTLDHLSLPHIMHAILAAASPEALPNSAPRQGPFGTGSSCHPSAWW
jgi:hypothetical protein